MLQQFCVIPEPNGKCRLCLEPAKLNQAITQSVLSLPTHNAIFPKLINVKYSSVTDVKSGYHNLRLEDQSSYSTTFLCQFGRYRYKWVPFGAASAGNMVQRKIYDIFKELPNMFVISDDIIVVGYDNKNMDHGNTLRSVLLICRKVNLKLNKGKFHLRFSSVPLFGMIIPGMV